MNENKIYKKNALFSDASSGHRTQFSHLDIPTAVLSTYEWRNPRKKRYSYRERGGAHASLNQRRRQLVAVSKGKGGSENRTPSKGENGEIRVSFLTVRISLRARAWTGRPADAEGTKAAPSKRRDPNGVVMEKTPSMEALY